MWWCPALPKKTVEQIIDSQNHYLLQVKGNQPSLYNDIEQVSQTTQPLGVYEKEEKNRGREEYRKVSIFSVSNEEKQKQWKDLSTYVVVDRLRNGQQERAFYISDLVNKDAEFFYLAIREHWGIENGLHYVKDVVYNEDKNRIKNDTAAVLASIMSSVAINISRKEQEVSITYSQIFFRSNVEKALKFIRT